jgi:hypothetical protein
MFLLILPASRPFSAGDRDTLLARFPLELDLCHRLIIIIIVIENSDKCKEKTKPKGLSLGLGFQLFEYLSILQVYCKFRIR